MVKVSFKQINYSIEIERLRNSVTASTRCGILKDVATASIKRGHIHRGLLLRRAANFISQHPESERPSQTRRWRSLFADLTTRIESEGRAPDLLGLRQSFADRNVSSTANATEAVGPSSASRFGFLTNSCHGLLSVGDSLGKSLQGTSHRRKAKPTWLNTLRYSTTSVYSSTGSPAGWVALHLVIRQQESKH
jgi:hypothetical protein